MIDTFKAYLDKTNLSVRPKTVHRAVRQRDQEEPYGIQGMACGSLQTADGKSPTAWNELLP